MPRPNNPTDAWRALVDGNKRFVGGTQAHPNQDGDRRTALAEKQLPYAALFGCADSRLSAEIIFDVGLGDLFVVRNAGQVIAETILGSLEYAVEMLGVSVILVLGHDECGAVRSAMDSSSGKLRAKGEFIQHIVARIQPTVTRAFAQGKTDIDEVTELHVQETIDEILSRSKVIKEAVQAGKLGVVGANYKLALGEIQPISLVGEFK
jgi:carbonic anhydrase